MHHLVFIDTELHLSFFYPVTQFCTIRISSQTVLNTRHYFVLSAHFVTKILISFSEYFMSLWNSNLWICWQHRLSTDFSRTLFV